MNGSVGNLISLSDSHSSTSTSLVCLSPPSSSAFTGTEGSKNNGGAVEIGQAAESSGLLIDFADEIQVPLPPAILTQAEVDDTFGIFSRAQSQSSQEEKKVAVENDQVHTSESNDDDAAKLVRSFTSGRKSVEKEQPKKEDSLEGETEEKDKVTKKDKNDSVESADSDQPTVVDPTDIEKALSPGSPMAEFSGDQTGISDEKMDLSTNFSGGSESELLDINNLSSFSIPDADQNTEDFIEDIKKEDMAESSVSTAILNQIKLELLHEEDKHDDDAVLSYRTRRNLTERESSRRASVTSDVEEKQSDKHFSATSYPGFASTVKTTASKQRLSISSVRSNPTRLSAISDRGFDDETGSNFDQTGSSRGRGSTSSRLSSGIMNSSPIRASFPLSKYYMPTPSSKTPSRHAFRDSKFMEPIYSPSRTRVVLVTGDNPRSPSTRVPVRKSISVETLHYEKSPYRDAPRSIPKFSTPSASSKSKYSITVQPDAYFSGNRGRDISLNHSSFTEEDHPNDRNRFLYMRPRQGRISFASSSTSVNHSSPPNSPEAASADVGRRDVAQLCHQMRDTNLNGTVTDFNRGAATNASSILSTIQPLKATAIIPPTKEFTSEAQNAVEMKAPAPAPVTKTRKPGISVTTTSGQRKFVPPVAASSPKTGPSPSRPNARTTPSRSRYSVNNVRSSGYGPQPQNLNSTFERKPPLISPNKVPSSTTTSIKPPAIPNSSKVGIASGLGKGVETSIASSGVGGRTGLPAPKILKAPTVTSGLKRPGITATVSNKENNARTALGSRLGLPKPRH